MPISCETTLPIRAFSELQSLDVRLTTWGLTFSWNTEVSFMKISWWSVTLTPAENVHIRHQLLFNSVFCWLTCNTQYRWFLFSWNSELNTVCNRLSPNIRKDGFSWYGDCFCYPFGYWFLCFSECCPILFHAHIVKSNSLLAIIISSLKTELLSSPRGLGCSWN